MYKNALLTYIDILGFKKLIESQSPSDIKRILLHLSKESDRISDARIKWVHSLGVSYKSFKFSDLIVRVYVFDDENDIFKYDILAYELENLAKIQREIPSQNYLIRGAISFDKVYIKGNMIFGPALISSYLLETNEAVYPIIILEKKLGDELFEKVQAVTETELGEREIYAESILSSIKILKKDHDYYYINYPRFSPDDFEYELISDDEFFLAHYELISTQLSFEHDEKIRKKYEWLREFHNKSFLEAKKRNPELGHYKL